MIQRDKPGTYVPKGTMHTMAWISGQCISMALLFLCVKIFGMPSWNLVIFLGLAGVVLFFAAILQGILDLKRGTNDSTKE